MKFNATKFVAGCAIAAVTISAAVFVSWLVFGRSLEQDVRRMIVTMSALSSVSVKTELIERHTTAISIFPLGEDATVRFGAVGAIDLSDKTHPHYVQQFALKTSIDGANVFGEYRDLPLAKYLYLTTAPNYGDINLTAFAKQWIVIPPDFSFGVLLGREPLQDLTEENLSSLMRLLNQIDLVDVSKTGIVEIIDHDATLPYTFTINADGMKTFLATWFEVRQGREIDPVSYQQIQNEVSDLLGLKGTMWIGRKSFLLHRVSVQSPTIDLTINLRDFNKPVDVSAPEPDTDFVTLLGQLGFHVGALPEASSATTPFPPEDVDANKETALPPTASTKDGDPDADGLDNGYEFFYGTNPANPDTDGDGVNDGEEVRTGQNPKGKGSLFSFGVL